MESKKEYHDPDYPEASVSAKEGQQSLSEEQKLEKIKNIVRKEFGSELDVRENEVMLTDQRVLIARRALHQLRYTLVNNYYRQHKLEPTASQLQDELASQTEPRPRTEVSSLLLDGQRQIHPSLRKLLGKKTVDYKEIFKIREPRNKARKDYSAMLQKRNYTVPADSTKTLRPEPQKQESEPLSPDILEKSEKPKKIPRHLEPKITNIVTLDEATRNKMKHRYRIIIGNTSKFAPGASRADRATHTWLLYVRGAAAVVRAVAVRLHPSYAPHHLLRLEKPPFQVSRRGWGEFPARVELHFALPERNRPAAVDHTIRLDRHRTGLQTLGAETVVDVWLYSTLEMLEHEYKEDIPMHPSSEAGNAQENEERDADGRNEIDNDIPSKGKVKEEMTIKKEIGESGKLNDNWLEFFSKDSTELNVDEMLVKDANKKVMGLNHVENPIDSDVVSKTSECNMNESITDHRMQEMEKLQISPPTEQVPTEQMQTEQMPAEQVPVEILSQGSCVKKRIMKYMDPTTRKIYYLEMDRELDLTKVQEIVINSQGEKKTARISPIKSNGLKHVRKMKGGSTHLRTEMKMQPKHEARNGDRTVSNCYSHIENDHCYLAREVPEAGEAEACGDEAAALRAAVPRSPSVRLAVNYLLKHIPLISEKAKNPEYLRYLPFVVESEERYWKLDFAKRRNIEWSRAKLINRILIDNFKSEEQIWRTKQILIYSRLHGFFPIRPDVQTRSDKSEENWSSWNFGDAYRTGDGGDGGACANAHFNTLTIFDMDEFNNNGNNSLSDSINQSDSDEEIDIVKCETKVKVKSESVSESSLEVLPVGSEEERLRFSFIERKCADIGVELRNEHVGNGYAYSAVHAVLLSAMRSLAEELLRASLASLQLDSQTQPLVWASGARRRTLGLGSVLAALRGSPRLRTLTRSGLGAHAHRPQPL